MKKLFIIKTGSTFDHIKVLYSDFEHWIMEKINSPFPIEVVKVRDGATLPKNEEIAGVIITGSHNMVTEELEWSVKIEKWLPEISKSGTPILGICYGHQLINKALGGVSGFNPNGLELGTNEVFLKETAQNDPLFKDIPKSFPAHTVHAQSILQLPDDAISLAKNEKEPNHSFRINNFTWGVQFHPEFSADIMSAYVKQVGKLKELEETEIEHLYNKVRPTNFSKKILDNFLSIVLTHHKN